MRKTRFILNVSGWGTVCEEAVLADRAPRRMRGLMGRSELPPGEGMLLRPAPAIHTAFMRFPIDALFLDGESKVVSVVEHLGPWRTASNRKARAVLELAAGEARRLGIEEGHQLLVLAEDPGAHPSREWSQPESDRQSDPRSDANQANAEARILLVAPDRRFRTVASALLERHGCGVATSASPEEVGEIIQHHRPQVVVLDAGHSLTAIAPVIASLQRIDPPVGIVLVADEPHPDLSGFQMLPKWGAFADLLSAVDEALSERGHRRSVVEHV